MMEPQWITFDLDGTLMQNPFGKWVFPEINRTVNDKITSDMIRLHNEHMRNRRYVEAYDWQGVLDEVLLSKGLNVHIDVEEMVVRHSVIPKVHLLEDGIASALQALKADGFRLAVLTNGFAIYQLPVLKALQIDALFDCIITPEMAGTAKPDARMADGLRNKGKIIAHVGDRIDHDVTLGNELGVVSVLIGRDLPEALYGTLPGLRSQTAEGEAYCLAKWRKESGEPADVLPPEQTPAVMIRSIQELPGVLNAN